MTDAASIAPEFAWHIFIAHADDEHAQQQAESLFHALAASYRVFLASQCLLPGDLRDIELSAAQSQSLVTVVLISERSTKEWYQRDEIAAAIEMARHEKRRHRVVPVYLDGPRPLFGLDRLVGLESSGDASDVADRLIELMRDLGYPGCAIDTSQVSAGDNRPAGAGADPDPLVQTFHLDMEPLWMEVDEAGNLWMADETDLRVYRLGNPKPERRQLACYKTIFPGAWQGAVVCADWDGGLHAVRPSDPEPYVLKESGSADTPIHLVTTVDDTLFAVSWNGTLARWRGFNTSEPMGRVDAGLVKYLLPVGSGLAAIDEHGLLLLGAERRELWPGITHAWSDVRRSRIFACSADRMYIDGREVGTPGLPCAHRRGAWGGTLFNSAEGLRWWLWANERADDIPLDFAVRVVRLPRRPQRPREVCIVGLDGDGRVFTVRDEDVQRHRLTGTDVMCDASGALLYLRTGQRIDVYRNPMIEHACNVEVVELDGRLEVDAYEQLRVVVRNCGNVPIQRLTARLIGSGRIDEAGDDHDGLLPCGASATLRFSVRARVRGRSVPVELETRVDGLGLSATVQRHPLEVLVGLDR